MVRENLEDLRVFSRQGRIVPHVIRRPAALQIERPAPRPLPFFPLRGRVDEPVSSRTLHIVTNHAAKLSAQRPKSRLRRRSRAWRHI